MKNINFSWVSLLNGAIFTDLLFTNMLLWKVFESQTLREWYRSFGAIAVLQDVLILVIGVLIAYFIYPLLFSSFSLIFFIILAVIIQLIHDVLFGYLISIFQKGNNKIFDLFKRYATAHGGYILVADALMIISTILSMNIFSQWGTNANYVLMVVLLYIYPYFLYSV